MWKIIIMLQKSLLPNKYKKPGWLLLVLGALLWVLVLIYGDGSIPLDTKMFAIVYGDLIKDTRYFTFVDMNISNSLAGILFIAGALLVIFSKEKNEDEFISNLRQSSLLWAVLVNYILLLCAFLFIHGMAFLDVMLYNMFTVLIIFIARFYYVLYRNAKSMSREKYN